MTNRGRILIIDASVTNTILLDAVLKQEGYRIATAYSAKEALRSVEENLPDLILMDLLIPMSNGVEFFKKLKTHNRYKSIPIIIVTAMNNTEKIDAAKKLGASCFIHKPIEILTFLEKVNWAFKNKRAQC